MAYLLRYMLARLRSFFRKAPLDRELDAEMTSHLEMAVEENIGRGMHPEEARRQALVRFGGVQQAREQQRETRGLPWLDVLLQDLRFTLRTLRRDRSFTIVAVLILALGIGANIAVFSVVNTLLLRPLPFHDSQQLAWFAGNNGIGGLSDVTYRVDAYEDYARANHSFQEMTAFSPYYSLSETKLVGKGEPKPLQSVWVAGNFFQMLGVRPVLGRLFLPEESMKGGSPAALLSYALWQRQFHADPKIVGQAVTLGQDRVTIVGVLPETFDFGAVFVPGMKIDLFVPLKMDTIRGWGHMLSVIGRLKPGVTIAQAQAEANTLYPQLRLQAHGDDSWSTDIVTSMMGLKEYISGKLRQSLIVLWCAVGLILLIVCVNLSNLLLARASSRSKEFAMRSALGAGRGRLVRQLLTESLVLSGAGAVLGLAFAYAVVVYLAHQGSIALPLLSSLRVDASVLGWTLLVALAAGLLFGMAPALRTSGGNLQDALKDGGHNASDGRKHERMRALLVVSEIGLACVLLVGAGLLLRSFLNVLRVDLGFEPSRAAAIKVDYDDGRNPERRGAILQEMLQRVDAIPGIEAAGISDMLPLDRNRSWELYAKGTYDKTKNYDAFVYVVTPGYIKAMGMRLRSGRDFYWNDAGKSEHVIIINEAAARREWPGQDPVGRLADGIGDGDTRVVGVISDVRESGVEEASSPQVLVPVMQANPNGAELVVRTKLPPEVLASSVMGIMRQMNPGQPATEFRPVQQIVDHATSPRRFFVLLVATFAALGLLLASLGIYGVISYAVTRQTQEIGIRMALGATAGRVQKDVLARTLRLALIGIGLGTVASFITARWIASLLFGTEPTDLLTFSGTILLLAMTALIAGYIPARRASRIDPMIALRAN
ncbi:MAG TPA: ABC transporter permease [Alloacidobacterium sp.]|nr:ABC transporter permease [Alloacidobacterium sp.]